MKTVTGKPSGPHRYSGAMARIVVAPDSFKGSLSATVAADALGEGWLAVRPHDTLSSFPMADGGEGTLDAIAHARPDASWHYDTVTGPAGVPVQAAWLSLPDGTAVLELAQTSGLPQMTTLDALGATTRGLGELITIAIDRGVSEIMIGLGGSATTDAGIGLLEGLGATVVRARPGARGASQVESIDMSTAKTPPSRGITLLTDTTALMLEAPRIFGPQKGADDTDVALAEESFRQLLSVSGDPTAHLQPGSGAAGATAWALMFFLQATVRPGAPELAQLIGLDTAIASADYVITGEGKFDHTSLMGKVVGDVTGTATQSRVTGGIVAGSANAPPPPGWDLVELVECVGSLEAALSDAPRALTIAGERLARAYNVDD